ncbi:GNAT family N-acetyltransferase [Arcanobacterium pinnipediorum]|uniref:GNAT family N-acetyltransferase n=1 Tax=Arcanobacterium pinnipediorum TaxID=1503041 RepID=A0ABY5AJ04_9ACTO|nr:GNAT family N-acetyltransferase [Arcanobacterium pinnipediorum]USR80178.1 GNAT family N-acetyltransferase [Arcanobacterium pinnipediorum]
MIDNDFALLWQLEIEPHWHGITPIAQVYDQDLWLKFGYQDELLTLDILGEPDKVIGELHRLKLHHQRPDIVLLPRAVKPLLNAQLCEYFGPSFGWDWDFYYAKSALDEVDHTNRVDFVSADSVQYNQYANDIRAVLQLANPISDSLSYFEKLSWFVIWEGDEIAAVLGVEIKDSRAHLHGLGTSPKYRGRGYAQALMVGAINQLLRHYQVVYFSMWGWNHVARTLYEKIGVHHAAALTHARREPFIELNSQ